jgi:hypothetical protein
LFHEKDTDKYYYLESGLLGADADYTYYYIKEDGNITHVVQRKNVDGEIKVYEWDQEKKVEDYRGIEHTFSDYSKNLILTLSVDLQNAILSMKQMEILCQYLM